MIDLVDWKDDMKRSNLDERVKEQRIKDKADILKQEALYQEKMLKIKHNDIQVEDIEQVNDLLFDSLEAKLSLLNNFNQNYET